MEQQHPVLITGAAQRLGLAVAKHLRTQGYPVIVSYRNEKPGLNALAAMGVKLLQADFSSDTGIRDFIAQVRQHTPILRAIIHNASDWVAEGGELSDNEVMQRMLQVHVQAPYQINLALSDLLQQSEQFTDIIHMTDYVQSTGSKKHVAYAASKAAMHNLTLSFASLLAPKVKVNSIAPALLMFNSGDSEAYRQKALSKSLLQTCPGAQEAVKAVSYLLESDYLTGQTLHLDGGRHLK